MADVPRAQQLRSAYEKVSAPVLALMPIASTDAPRYGVPIVKADDGHGLLLIAGLAEKPQPHEAPSNYAAIGGYLITAGVVAHLEERVRRWRETHMGEIYLTDALHSFAADNPVYGQVIDGTWWDTGSPLNYLKGQFAAGLAHPDYGPALREFIRDLDPRRLRPPLIGQASGCC